MRRSSRAPVTLDRRTCRHCSRRCTAPLATHRIEIVHHREARAIRLRYGTGVALDLAGVQRAHELAAIYRLAGWLDEAAERLVTATLIEMPLCGGRFGTVPLAMRAAVIQEDLRVLARGHSVVP